jgi:hypothetical protein
MPEVPPDESGEPPEPRLSDEDEHATALSMPVNNVQRTIFKPVEAACANTIRSSLKKGQHPSPLESGTSSGFLP